MKQFLKSYLLIISIILGVLFYKPLGYLKVLTPYLIFAMLLLSYSRLSFSELKIKKYHIFLLLSQVILSVAIYLALYKLNVVVAQASMLCVLIPTASAAVVITKMLDGNIASLTTYSLLSNFIVAIIAPIMLSFLSESNIELFTTFWSIITKVAPVLLLPFIVAAIIRKYIPVINTCLLKVENLSLYLWSLALMIATSNIFVLVKNHEESNLLFTVIASISFVICISQFYFGRKTGKGFCDTVAMGQGYGQKNTILGIWIAQAFLNPLASAGPGAYVIWQSIVNSYQLWKKGKEKHNTNE